MVEELATYLGRTTRQVIESLQFLADDWDTLSIDNDGWEEGYPDPEFLAAWRRHRRVYRYTLRSELVYQLLLQVRSRPNVDPIAEGSILLVDEYQGLRSYDLKTIELLWRKSKAEVL